MSPAVSPQKLAEARRRTGKIVRCGLLAALAWLCLIAAVLLPNISLSCRLGAVFCVLAGLHQAALPGGLSVYAVSMLLNFLYPGALHNLLYEIYLAPYPLLAWALSAAAKKWQAKGKPVLSRYGLLALRLLLGVGLFLTLAAIYGSAFLAPAIRERLGSFRVPALLLLAVLGTAFYDYLLALLSAFYETHLARLLRFRH